MPNATNPLPSAEKGLPADGTEVTIATSGMPGVFVGDRAVVRHQSPSGHSNIERGLVWLDCAVRWSHGTAHGFWASRSEYVIPARHEAPMPDAENDRRCGWQEEWDDIVGPLDGYRPTKPMPLDDGYDETYAERYDPR